MSGIQQFVLRVMMTAVCGVGLGGCAQLSEETCVSNPAQHAAFKLSGTVSFGYVPSVLSGGNGKLNFNAVELRPSRRIVVQAVDNCDRAVAETITDDTGFYSLSVPGHEVHVKAVSRLVASSFSNRPTDGTSFTTACSGSASWDFNVVDNTASQSLYGFFSDAAYTANSSSADLSIPLEYDASSATYVDRSAAPFALADTIVDSFEKVCRAAPGTQFPKLMINWSVRNQPTSGDKTKGSISTSHFTIEAGLPQLYILGKEDVDTDEYDAHVVAHEFGHYLEYSLYRSDTVGGSHSVYDRLDARVAFGEGYGNAFSAIATDDPYYVDSMGAAAQSGSGMNIGASTKGSTYNGIYNEKSVQYFLWSLYQNKGDFSHIHQILKNHQSVSPAFTTLLTFAAHYNAQFGGSSQSLRTLWETELESPYNALCTASSCSGSGDQADPFDSKQLLGGSYAASRTYGGAFKSAAFWNLYKPLFLNVSHVADGHDVIDSGNSGYPYNKFGFIRWYVYKHTNDSSPVSIAVSNLDGGGKSCTARDWLDMYVFGIVGSSQQMSLVTEDERTTGCPSVSFFAEKGRSYVVTVNGQVSSGGNISSYNINVRN